MWPYFDAPIPVHIYTTTCNIYSLCPLWRLLRWSVYHSAVNRVFYILLALQLTYMHSLFVFVPHV